MLIGVPGHPQPPYINECGLYNFHRRPTCHLPGSIAEVVHMIFTELKIDYYIVPTNLTAAGVHVNGSYDGYLGAVHRGEVDTFASDFTPTNERMEHLAFSQPYMIDDWVVAAPINRRQNDLADHAFLLFRMFTAQVWMSLFWMLAILALARVMAEWCVLGVPSAGIILNGGFVAAPSTRKRRSAGDIRLSSASWSAFDDRASIRSHLYHQTHVPPPPPRPPPRARDGLIFSRSLSLKIIVTISAYTFLIFQNVYKGCLLSSLLFKSRHASFTTIEGMIEAIASHDVHLSLERPNTALYPAILNGTSKSMLDLRAALASNAIRFENMTDILLDVQSSDAVTINKEAYLTGLSLNLCNVRTFRVDLEGVNPYLALPLSVGAARRYRYKIDELILANMDRIGKIVSRYKHGTSCGEFVEEDGRKTPALALTQMLGAVLIYCIGIGMAVIAHLCQVGYHRRRVLLNFVNYAAR